MFTGVISTLLIPETAQQSLEVLSNESQEEFIQGVFLTALCTYVSDVCPLIPSRPTLRN